MKKHINYISLSNSLEFISDDLIFDNNQLLGRGAQAAVYKGEYKGQVVAVKAIKKKSSDEKSNYFEKELKISKLVKEKIKQKNVVEVIDVIQNQANPKYGYVVMEYCQDSLYSLIKSQYKFTHEEIEDIIFQIASALQALHEHGITHRDVKPQNIFYTTCPKTNLKIYKLGDFGLSKSDPFMTTKAGTIIYMAPEICQFNNYQYDNKIDVWSLGLIMHELLVGESLFNLEAGRSEAMQRIIRFKSYIEMWQNKKYLSQIVCESDAQLMHKMIMFDKDQRWEISQVREYLLRRQNQQLNQYEKPEDLDNARMKQSCFCCEENQMEIQKQKEKQNAEIQNIDEEIQKINNDSKMLIASKKSKQNLIQEEQRKYNKLKIDNSDLQREMNDLKFYAQKQQLEDQERINKKKEEIQDQKELLKEQQDEFKVSLQKITEESKIKDNAVILIVIKSIIIIFLIAWIAVSNSKNIPAENSQTKPTETINQTFEGNQNLTSSQTTNKQLQKEESSNTNYQFTEIGVEGQNEFAQKNQQMNKIQNQLRTGNEGDFERHIRNPKILQKLENL